MTVIGKVLESVGSVAYQFYEILTFSFPFCKIITITVFSKMLFISENLFFDSNIPHIHSWLGAQHFIV